MSMNTPKVKMPLLQADLKELLGVPSEVEVISAWIDFDPLKITLVFASDDAFDALYAPLGGYDPGISAETISKTFFTE